VATTDAAGSVQSEVTYEPFGNTEMSAPAPAYRFTGREDDEPLYLYYYRARYYHTDLQRFISEDPIGFSGGDINLYAYVGSRPTVLRDPLGLWLPDDHYAQALAVSLKCGLSFDVASGMAAADKAVDDNVIRTLSPSAVEHAMPGTPWREYVEMQLALAIELGNAGNYLGARRALGRGLHAVQDAWSHDLRTPQGTIGEHIPRFRRDTGERWISPDSTSGNPSEWMQSRLASLEYVERFMSGRGKPHTCDSR
jgi:RHS repeat-associated protein